MEEKNKTRHTGCLWVVVISLGSLFVVMMLSAMFAWGAVSAARESESEAEYVDWLADRHEEYVEHAQVWAATVNNRNTNDRWLVNALSAYDEMVSVYDTVSDRMPPNGMIQLYGDWIGMANKCNKGIGELMTAPAIDIPALIEQGNDCANGMEMAALLIAYAQKYGKPVKPLQP